MPGVKWTTGEHEYTRYGMRKLIEDRSIDILQPDVMWCVVLSTFKTKVTDLFLRCTQGWRID